MICPVCGKEIKGKMELSLRGVTSYYICSCGYGCKHYKTNWERIKNTKCSR